METKLPGPPGQPEEKKPPSAKEIAAKKEQVFGNALAELVEKDIIFAERAGEIDRLLGNKLKEPLPDLSNSDRELLEEAKNHYAEITAEPYLWFGKDTTPDAIKKMEPGTRKARCSDLCKTLQDNNDPRTKAINKRIELLQWMNVHFLDINKIINSQKNPLRLGDDKNYLPIPGKKGEETQQLSQKDVAGQFLILPIQRSPQIMTTMKELLENAASDQTPELTSLETKWKTAAQTTNELVRASEVDNKELINLLKKLPPAKLPYVLPPIKKELEERYTLTKQLKDAQTSIKTYENKKTDKTLEDKGKKEVDKLLKVEKKAVGILEKKIKAIDSVLEKKAKVLNAISTQELELFSASDPKSTSAFSNRDKLVKLTTDIRHHQKEITLLFDEQKYQDINNKIKERLAISDKTFELFISRDYQSIINSPNNREEVKKLKTDVPQHLTEIRSLFSKKGYYEEIFTALNKKHDENRTEAITKLPPNEFQFFSNPNFILPKKTQDRINLTADILIHGPEIIFLFGKEKASPIFQTLRNKIDPDVINALDTFPRQEIALFRGQSQTIFNSLNTEELGKLNLAVRDHRDELTRVFGKDAYPEISKAFAKEYKSRSLTEAIAQNDKAIDTLLLNRKTLTPSERETYEALSSKRVTLINERQNISPPPHQELEKLSDKELKLFTNPTSTLQDLKIKDLVKLSTDIRAHRQEITLIFGEKAYQDMGKAFVERYRALIPDNKGAREKWGGYTHQQKADAADRLLEAIGTSAKPNLNPETLKTLREGRLGKITKLLEETEKEKLKEPNPPPQTTPTRPGRS